MRIRNLGHWSALIALGAAGLAHADVYAKSPVQSFLATGAQIEPPRGFVMMCDRTADPRLCTDTNSQGDPQMETGGIIVRGSASVVMHGGMKAEAAPFLNALQPLPDLQLKPQFSKEPSFASAPLSERFPIFAPLPIFEPLPAPVAPTVEVAAVASRVHRSTPQPVAAADAMAMLKKVNRTVNGRVRQDTDFALYGRDEYWTSSGVGPQAVGDCEDLAIEKRMELADAGFPADRLAFAIVYSQAAGLHTVLVARLDHTDVVLDNRTIAIRRWSDSEYSFIGIQDFNNPMRWFAVDKRIG